MRRICHSIQSVGDNIVMGLIIGAYAIIADFFR